MDDEKEIPYVLNPGIFIREFLLANGPASAWELWKAWRDFKRSLGRKGPTYSSFWQNYIYPLKRLGLLLEVGEEPAEYENSLPRKLLDVNHAELDADAWFDPKVALYGGTVVRSTREPRGPVSVPEKPKKHMREKKTSKRKRVKTEKRGAEVVREFLEAYYNTPTEGWAHTPTELMREKWRVEEALKEAEKQRKRKARQSKKKQGGSKTRGKKKTTEKEAESSKRTTRSRKGKESKKKPAETTKKTAKREGARKPKKKAQEAPQPRAYSSVEEMMRELSPEERELLRKLAGRD